MEKHAQALTVAAADWGPWASDLLQDCFTVPGALYQVKRQVESGQAQLFTAETGGEIVAAFVLRVDGSEGVIVAATGPVDIIPALLSNMEARFIGCDAVRFHTARPGLAKLMAAHGYGGQEIVLRKKL